MDCLTRTRLTEGQRNALTQAVLKALDPNGAPIRQAEIVDGTRLHASVAVDGVVLGAAWDFALLVGQSLQRMKLARTVVFVKGAGGGWKTYSAQQQSAGEGVPAILTDTRAAVLRFVWSAGAVSASNLVAAGVIRNSKRSAIKALRDLHALGYLVPVRICEYILSDLGGAWVDSDRAVQR
jgi:hypothetical protein